MIKSYIAEFVEANLKTVSNQSFPRYIFLVAVILLLIAALLSMILEQYYHEFKRSMSDRNRNEAKVMMAALQSDMVEEKVIQQGLDDFAEKALRFFGRSRLTPAIAGKLNQIFYRQFPSRSTLLWFSDDFASVVPDGENEPTQKRAWQAFARSIVDKVSDLDLKIADGFVKSNISDFLDAGYFSGLTQSCQLIMFKGERNYIYMVSFGRGRGHLLFLIPTSHARQFWLEERALLQLQRRSELAGAYVLSRNLAINNSTISDNLLHGLAQQFNSGHSYLTLNNVSYFTDRHFADPDILLAIGIRQKEPERLHELLLLSAGILVWLPGVICLLLPLSGISSVYFDWSLKTRFNLITIALIVLPLLTGGITSAINTGRIGLEMQNDEFGQLEKRLAEVEDEVALQVSNFELYLKTSMTDFVVDEEPSQEITQKIYDELKSYGCEVVIMILPDGRSWVASDLPPSTIRQRNCYLVSLTRNDLQKYGFALEAIDKAFPLPTRSLARDVNEEVVMSFNLKNQFRRFDFAGNTFSSFVSYVNDRKGRVKANLNLGFNHKRMLKTFLAKVSREPAGSLSRLYFSGQLDKNVQRLPASKRLTKVLKSSQVTGDSFRFMHEWKGSQYLVYTRPLKDLDSVGMVVKKVASQGFDPRREQVVSFLVTSLAAILVAIMIISFFSNYFLRPLLRLSNLAARVEAGDYSKVSFSNMLKDEIGMLADNFGQLIAGLREKAEMRNYLRADLFEHAAEEQKIVAERCEVTVLFAGIRDFSTFEDLVSPEEAMHVMSSFLSICEQSVKECGGDIDKFIGDTAMAAFKPKIGFNAECQAIKAALMINRRLKESIEEQPAFSKLSTGIGIASGPVIAGHIGSLHNRLDYTFIGDTVNLAARLEKLAGRDGRESILTTGSLYQRSGDVFCGRLLESIKVKGKSLPVEVVAITGSREVSA